MPPPAGPRSWTRTVPGLAAAPIAANAAPPWRTIHGTAASVWTLLTTVGLSNRPFSVGYGGCCSGWPRLPSSALSRTVSSPSMYAPWTGRTVTVTRWPEPSDVVAQEARLLGREDRALEHA